MNPFSGTGVALITPFTEDLQVDIPALRRITRNMIQGNIDSLVILGTTGESATLTAEEQKLVIETILEENDGELPIVLGIGGNNTAAVCKKAEAWSKQYKPSAVLSVSPYYNKPSQEGIYQHYKALASSTDASIILYNVPGRTASNVSAETCLRLAHDIENVVAMKEASGDIDQVMKIIAGRPEGFSLLSGDDHLVLPYVSLGGDGIISVTANAFPAKFSEMVRASLSGNWDFARKLHFEMLPLTKLNFAEGNPVGVKSLMNLLGVCKSDVRLPLVKATQDLVNKMQAELSPA
ncbi:MAG: 4-hydroxy-tetrahydrodipicolinate synthase [Bacteroidia bacterium]|nr:4-hydroxy-tetrahydrodipicolinate synthase [Bacteroidia bacterium]